MDQVYETIASFIAENLGVNAEQIQPLINSTPDPEMGDYGVPCFPLAKILRKNPATIATELADKFQPSKYIDKCLAIEGYLNFFLNRVNYSETVLHEIHNQGTSYGKDSIGVNKTIVIDYGSQNIAKPFGISHIRTLLIGNALYKIFNELGYRVIRVNHLGDWGTQFGKLIHAYKLWGDSNQLKQNPLIHLLHLYRKFHREAETDDSLNESARNWFKKLESGDKETIETWKQFRDISLEKFKELYGILDIEFDYYHGESFYNDKLPTTMENLRNAKVLEESQDALIVNLDEYNLPPALIQKSDGTSLYLTRDIAAAEFRHKEFNFHKCLYVVGVPQKLHFQQLKLVLKKMGYSWWNDIIHVEFGHIAGLTTRGQGDFILLEDVINEATEKAAKILESRTVEKEARIGKIHNDEKLAIARLVGLGALVFADLKNRRIKDFEFDWDRVLSFEGDTGPYCQNAHVRCSGIFRKYTGDITPDIDYSLITSDEEFNLVKKLAEFPVTVRKAAEKFEPSIISAYVLNLGKIFNIFLVKHRVLSDNEQLTKSRVLLVHSVKLVLAKSLRILGIKPLERM